MNTQPWHWDDDIAEYQNVYLSVGTSVKHVKSNRYGKLIKKIGQYCVVRISGNIETIHKRELTAAMDGKTALCRVLE